jgi:hypothetical protein
MKDHIMHRNCILTHVTEDTRDGNMRKQTSADTGCPSRKRENTGDLRRKH